MPTITKKDSITANHRKQDILEAGYVETGFKLLALQGCPGAHEMFNAARALDAPEENFTAFRTGDNQWEHFLLPGKTIGVGHASRSILPKR